jgi:hypothetical protein
MTEAAPRTSSIVARRPGTRPRIPVAVTFMIVHLVLAAVVAALPLGRWVDRRLATRDDGVTMR